MEPLKNTKDLERLSSLTLSRWSTSNSLEEEIDETILNNNIVGEEREEYERLKKYEELSTKVVEYLEVLVANTLEEWSYEDLSKFIKV